MYRRQKGFLPLISQVMGLLIVVYPTFAIIFYAVPRIFSSIGVEALLILLASILLVSFPLSIGWIILNSFPHIKIFQDGIGLLTSPITTKRMTWDEFELLHEFGNGYGALVIRSNKNITMNWFSLNKIYGLLTGIIDPVILLSPDTVSSIRQLTKNFSRA